MPTALDLLQETFGYTEFRLNQADIIDTLIAGHDALALMPTGGGKSLCYQIPALIRPGTGIIVSPLIALMHDQVSALAQFGVKAAFLNSTLSMQESREIERSLLNGELELLYVAPERLLMPNMLQLLKQSRISLFAIDEAHCVSQWGHDFRPNYQQLSVLHEHFPEVPRLALTATADERTQQEIIQQLNLHDAAVFISSFDRKNIRYTITSSQNGRDQLWSFLQAEHPHDAGIVYCLSRKKVEQTAVWLCGKGRIALPYHAGLPADTRQDNQTRFLRDESIIMVATIAFGMGIDKPDVRFVAHLNLPKSIEAYYQETGRAGRDGQAANAWMAYGLQDIIMLRQMMSGSDANEQYKRVVQHKLETMLGLCELTSCRRQTLLHYFGENLAKPCGNCDNCLSPPKTWDATEAAQKALSTAYRSEQRFGVTYLVNILTGKTDERITRNGHDQLSTFGIGADRSASEWRTLFRQLIALGYLDIDSEGFGSLTLTDKCRPLLRGEQALSLRQQSTQKKSRSRNKNTAQLPPYNESLFQDLRTLRTALAKEQGVPPYVIFHDAALTDMTQQRPESLQALSDINGIGEQKLARYGEAFLNVILQHPLAEVLNNNLSDTIKETLHLQSGGMKVEDIAKQRDLKTTTIYGHFAEAITAGVLQAEGLLPLSTKQYTQIRQSIELLSTCTEHSLANLFEALDEEYDYGILRCVVAEECR